MAERTLTLLFPLAGLHRGAGLQQQPPFTTPDCLNVRPFGAIEGRARGGSRPGLDAYAAGYVGQPDEPVRMLGVVNHDGVLPGTVGGSVRTFADQFLTLSPSLYTFPAWAEEPPVFTGGAPDVFREDVAAVRLDEIPGDALLEVVAAYAAPWARPHPSGVPDPPRHYGRVAVMARLDTEDPDPEQDGVTLEIDLSGGDGSYTAELTVAKGGVSTSYPLDPGTLPTPGAGGELLLTILPGSGSSTVACYFRGIPIGSEEIDDADMPAAGGRMAFRIRCDVSGGVQMVDHFRGMWVVGDGGEEHDWQDNRLLVASAGGSLAVEAPPGILTPVPDSDILDPDRLLVCDQHGGKLYIADFDPVPFRVGTGEADGAVLTDASLTADEAAALDPRIFVLEVTHVTSSAVPGVYQISSAQEGEITVAGTINSSTAEAVTYRIVRSVKVYDPATNSVGPLIPSVGQAPANCHLLARYFDCLVLADRRLWYMSRVGDPTDFNYGADPGDTGRAVAGRSTDGGVIGEPLTALAPLGDDHLIFGCEDSLWRLRGHPAYGGRIDSISRQVGVVDRAAWCYGPSGEMYFLSADGVYRLAPGAGTVPEPLGRDRLPRELRGVDRRTHDAILAFDLVDRGVHVFVTPRAGGATVHWFLDLAGFGWWPGWYQSRFGPCSAISLSAAGRTGGGTRSAVVLGGRDGRLFSHDARRYFDDGSVIDSRVLIGPAKVGRARDEARVSRIDAAAADGGQGLAWGLRAEPTAERAARPGDGPEGLLPPGESRTIRPRSRALYVALMLRGQLAPWAFESAEITVEPSGRRRR